MSHIEDDEPPIKTGVTSNAYRDNWERVFGEARKCTPDELAVDPTRDTDAIECTLRSYANLIVPLEAQIGPLEKVCEGSYDDGIADGNLTACSNREGCGLPGCPRERLRRDPVSVACVCDKPTCEWWPCKELRELRIAYAVVRRLVQDEGRVIVTAEDVLTEIEGDCEILCK